MNQNTRNTMVPCVYYPTTAVLVDDSVSFLNQVKFKLDKTQPCKIYSVASEALAVIKKAAQKSGILSTLMDVDADADTYYHMSRQLPLQINIAGLYKHAYDAARFSEISVAVIDYNMPEMTGEELCRQIKTVAGNPIKLIMLTGEADETIAIQLFNEGLIHKFLRKSDPNIDTVLLSTITEMQRAYFMDLSQALVKGLAVDKDCAIGDPAFHALFNKICQERHISSFYLIELTGSFILFDDAGKPSWLIIHTLDELREIADQMEDSGIARDLCKAVQAGDLVPYLTDPVSSFNKKKTEFQKYLYPANVLEGERSYRFALLDQVNEFVLDTNHIVSFDHYLANS